MNSVEFTVSIPMPFQGESIVDGVLVTWLVSTGDTVAKGQALAEIETEKSVWEFESPCDGRVSKLLADEGDIVDVGAPLLEMDTQDESAIHLKKEKTDTDSEGETETDSTAVSDEGSGNGAGPLSPRVRKYMKEKGITADDIAGVTGSGPSGRVTVEDLEALEAQKASSIPSAKAVTTCNIAGIGAYVPELVVENSEFAQHFPDIDGSYIEKVTGIKQRRWAVTESTSDMAYHAAVKAIDAAGIASTDLDLIILATTTPDMPLPASACKLQILLECPTVPAFDIAAACSGWLYGLSVARQFILAGTYRHILVVAAETMSKFTDKTDRATAFLFGDGAGAAVLSSELEGHELSAVAMEADGSGYDIIYRKAGAVGEPSVTADGTIEGYWVMDGGRMFRGAVEAFSKIIVDTCEREQAGVDEISWFVPHQANMRILKSVAHRIQADFGRFYSNIHRFGNTSAASIPLALTDLEAEHEIKKGDKVLFCAVGAGLTSAGCIVTW